MRKIMRIYELCRKQIFFGEVWNFDDKSFTLVWEESLMRDDVKCTSFSECITAINVSLTHYYIEMEKL